MVWWERSGARLHFAMRRPLVLVASAVARPASEAPASLVVVGGSEGPVLAGPALAGPAAA